MSNQRQGLDTARHSTVRVCRRNGEHRGQGLLLSLSNDGAVVLTCHHVIAPLEEDDVFVQIPQEDGRLGSPIQAKFDPERSRGAKDAVVLRIQATKNTSNPKLHSLNPATYAGFLQAVVLTHLQPNNFDAQIGVSTPLVVPAPDPGSWGQPIYEYHIPVTFRLANATDAREGISGGVVFSEGGVMGLVHFARAESAETARECYLVPLSTWAEDWPELSSLIEPLITRFSKWSLRGEAEPELALLRPFQAPALPTHFIERAAESTEIIERLLGKASDHNGILVVSALHGFAGVGKTALAAATAHSPIINDRFRDGVLWTTLGQKPDPLENLVSWIHSLGDRDYNPSTMTAASSYLRTLLYPRNLLLVIDDVWDAEHAKPFLTGGPKCAALITTRRAHVADDLGANLYALDVMTQSDALSLLKKRVELGRGRRLTQAEHAQALLLTQETGFLPLALDLIGALIARGYDWSEARNLLKVEQARRGDRPRQHRAQLKLEASLQVSLNSLRTEDEIAWKCFAWLGVLPDQVVLNSRMAATLWEVSNDEASRILNLLADEAIIQRAASGFTVHDLMHDMARQILASEVPDGLGIDIQKAHKVLLNRYATRTPSGDWAKLCDDGYIHSRLIWHFDQSGDREAIHRLICQSNEEGQNAWYLARDQLGQGAGYLDDIGSARRINLEADRFLVQRHTQYGLIRSSLHSLAQAISPQVLLILVRRKIWTVSKAFYYIRQMSWAYGRRRTLKDLFSILKDNQETSENQIDSGFEAVWPLVIRETRNLAAESSEAIEGAFLLANLAPYVSESEQFELVKEAVTLIKDVPDHLRKLSHEVPNPHRDFVLEAACDACTRISDPIMRVESLADVISYLSSSAKKRWILVIHQWINEVTREEEQPRNEEVVSERLLGEAQEPTGGQESGQAKLEFTHAEEPAQTQTSLALIVRDHSINDSVVAEDNPIPLTTAPAAVYFENSLELPETLFTKVLRIIPNLTLLVDDAIYDAEHVGSEENIPEQTIAKRAPSTTNPALILSQFRSALHREVPWFEQAIQLIPALSAPRSAYVREVLSANVFIGKERQGEMLTRMTEYLAPAERRQIALELIDAGKDSVGANCVLAMPEADPKQSELLNSMLPKLRNMSDRFHREAAMSSIARTCPTNFVRTALAAYLRIDDAREQASVTFALAPNLKGVIPSQVLERLSDESANGKQLAALTRMVSQLTIAIKSGMLDEFMKEASSLSSEWWIVEALTLAILRVDDKELLKLILESTTNIRLPDLRSRIVGRIMLRLVRLGYVEEALAAVDVTPQMDRWSVLTDLSNELAKDGLTTQAQKIAETIVDSEERSKAYATIAMYQAARGDVEGATLLASIIISKHWRKWIDTRLAMLNGSDVIPVLKETARPKSNVLATSWGEIRLESIAETVSGMLQREIVFKELEEILTNAKSNNLEETVEAIKRFWKAKVDGKRTYLDIISEQPRNRFLKELQRMRPLLNASLTEEEARDIVLAIHNVSSWWP